MLPSSRVGFDAGWRVGFRPASAGGVMADAVRTFDRAGYDAEIRVEFDAAFRAPTFTVAIDGLTQADMDAIVSGPCPMVSIELGWRDGVGALQGLSTVLFGRVRSFERTTGDFRYRTSFSGVDRDLGPSRVDRRRQGRPACQRGRHRLGSRLLRQSPTRRSGRGRGAGGPALGGSPEARGDARVIAEISRSFPRLSRRLRRSPLMLRDGRAPRRHLVGRRDQRRAARPDGGDRSRRGDAPTPVPSRGDASTATRTSPTLADTYALTLLGRPTSAGRRRERRSFRRPLRIRVDRRRRARCPGRARGARRPDRERRDRGDRRPAGAGLPGDRRHAHARRERGLRHIARPSTRSGSAAPNRPRANGEAHRWPRTSTAPPGGRHARVASSTWASSRARPCASESDRHAAAGGILSSGLADTPPPNLPVTARSTDPPTLLVDKAYLTPFAFGRPASSSPTTREPASCTSTTTASCTTPSSRGRSGVHGDSPTANSATGG